MAKIDMRVDDLIISLRLFAGNQLAGVAAAAIRQAVATAVGAKLAGGRRLAPSWQVTDDHGELGRWAAVTAEINAGLWHAPARNTGNG